MPLINNVMKVINDINALSSYKHVVVTIGSFDGVHCAHQQILDMLTSTAKKVDGVSVLVSFQPHPRTVIDPDFKFRVINTEKERNNHIEKAGIDFVLNIPFTKTFASLSYVDFIQFLISKINLHAIVLGYNHNFGRNREGNADLLKKLAKKYHFQVVEVKQQTVSLYSISSTLIRKLIIQGNIQDANKLLGYPYSVDICIDKELVANQEFCISLRYAIKVFPIEGTFDVKIKSYDAKINISNDNTVLVFDEKVKDITINQTYNVYFI